MVNPMPKRQFPLSPVEPTRELVAAVVRDNPGSTASDVARALDLSVKTVQYHVRFLEKSGAVIARRLPGRVRLYVPGMAPPRERAAAVDRASHPVADAILKEVEARQATTRRDLQSRLAYPRSTIGWHLRRLIDHGLVTERPTATGAHLALEAADSAA